MAGAQEIILERDGHDQPWGFRLQGGSDVGAPLSIQRILVGTPSEGVVRKGDILLRISKTDTRGLTHQQAADLFTNVGNQISVIIKRPGGSGSSATHTGPTNNPIAPPNPVPISGGVALPGMTSQDPKSKAGHHSGTSAPLSLTIQNQPYRTSPLIQPTAYEKLDLGPGSSQHLKLQADHITGVREGIAFTTDTKASDYSMNKKVTGTLQQIQQSSDSPYPQEQDLMQAQLPVKQYYNNPINLYSTENVAEVAKLNEMGISGLPGATSASPTGLLNPVNKPHKTWLNLGGLPRKYDPEQSATWQAIHETEKCQLVTEHGPTSSKVYSI